MVLRTPLFRIVIVLASIFTSNSSCRKLEAPLSVNEPKMDAPMLDNNCIQFVNPEWIDEITYFDTTVENYNSFVLRAFLKNNCSDTLAIGMNASALASSAIQWFFQNEDGFESIFTRSDSFHILFPGDSMYMYLTDLRSEYIYKIDSVKIDVPFKVRNQLLNRMVKIDGHNFIYRN